MDMIKMGNFLSILRKEHNLTQEELGQKLGVTNKTISRWETGAYMPPVDMLEELSTMYGLTINELLSGQKLSSEEYKDMAEHNIKEALRSSAFNLKEKQDYYKKKWLEEHIALMLFMGIVIIALFAIAFYHKSLLLTYVAIILLVVSHAYRNNTMMAYVERNAFDGSGN